MELTGETIETISKSIRLDMPAIGIVVVEVSPNGLTILDITTRPSIDALGSALVETIHGVLEAV